MAKFEVIKPLRHGGKDYRHGDTVELEDEELIEALSSEGIIIPGDARKKAQEAAKAAAAKAKK